ncbi:hypothetical protein [Sulfurimonas sp.]|uniref:hypothetical protein n=1 Tax=Sulfurimonas sp. TaxID=2022749 RepID=UPI0026083590|nr:hypothetical protein [Sulfurimonas sp.]
MKKSNKNLLLLGVSTITVMSLLSGCGKKPLPQPVDHDNYKPQAELFAPYSIKNETFSKEIVNHTNGPALRLNDYKPVGFNTRVYKLKKSGVLWNTPDTPQIPFEKVECKNKSSHVFIENIVMAPFVIGLNILLGGGMCDNQHVFDYKDFDETAKDWIEDEDINRIALIDKYDTLLQTEHKAENSLQKITNETNDELNQIFTQYQSNYLAKTPKVKVNIQDRSGFYHNEQLDTLTSIEHKALEKHPVDFTKSYVSLVDNSFPCTANDDCFQKLSSSKEKIETDFQTSIKEIKQKRKADAKKAYETYLTKQTNKISIISDYNEHQATIKHKTLFYHLKQMPQEINSDTKSITATYEIVAASFKDVFPKYYNSDKNIKVVFEPETQTIVLTNKTNQFIEIGSISLYYDGAIYKIANDRTQNFTSELSPNAVVRFNALTLWNSIKEATFNRVTVSSTRNKSLKFGLAIKYATLQPSQNHTIYKEDTHNLAKFLKQF